MVAYREARLLNPFGMALATLDLSLFTNGNHNTREAFAADLRKELSRHGFVKIVCHGLSDEDIGEVFEWVSVCRA